MGVWTSLITWFQTTQGTHKKGSRRHGDELFPPLFVRALEDRYVPSVSAFAPHSNILELAAATNRPTLLTTTATNSAPLAVNVAHTQSGLSIEVNGRELSTDSANQLATLSTIDGHPVIEVGSLLANSPVNLTITGLAGDTISLNGSLNLAGGSLQVTGQSIQVRGTITSSGGSVVLEAGSQGTLTVSGRIDVSDTAPGGIGGSVQLLGGRVALVNGASINASGDAGGGTVLIGVDVNGANPNGANPNALDAQQVYFAADAQVAANAIHSGNGGHVVVWADESTQFLGTISATGGAVSGNGGTVEVSGETLDFQGQVSTLAPHGAAGTLLVDPTDLVIDSTEAQTIVTDLQSGNVNLSASTIEVEAAIDASGNTGDNFSLTLTATSTITFETGGNITVNDAGLSINGGNMVLDAGIALSTAPASGTGGDIVISDPIDGGQNLSLNAGTSGTITLGGAVGNGTRLGSLTFVNSAGVTAQGNITAASLTQSAGSGTTEFEGTINTNSGSGVSITGAAVTFDQSVTATNGGGVSATNSGQLTMGSMTLGGAFSQQGGGNVSAAGTVTTSGGGITFTNAVTLTGTLSLNIGNSGNILFSSTIDGGEDLSLNADGNGTITLGGAVGSGTPLGGLSFVDSNGVTAEGDIMAASLTQSAGNGTTQFEGTINTDTAGGVSVTGATITFDQSVTATNGGGVSVNNSHQLTMGSMTLGGAFSQQGGGNVLAAGSVTTSGGGISFTNAVSLNGALSLDTSNSGNILFSSTIDGNENLSLNAGANGTITLAGAVGGGTRLAGLTFVNSDGVTAEGNITAASLTQSAGSGTTEFEGTINTNTASGVSVTGAAVTFDQSVTATSGGGVSVTNSGQLTMGSMTLGGAFSQQGGGNVSVAGNVTTSGGITFANAVTLTGALSLNTSNSGNILCSSTIDGGENLSLNAGASGTVTFGGAVGGGTRLGSLTFVNSAGVTAEGSITAASLTQSAGTGTTDFEGTINTDTGSGVSVVGAAVTFDQGVTATSSGGVSVTNSGQLTMGSMTLGGAFSQQGGGNVSAAGTVTASGGITFTNAVSLTGSLSLNTSNSGNILFSSTIDGGEDLSLNAGAGRSITLDGAVGSGTRLGGLTFADSNGLTADSSIAAASLTQSAGSGTSEFKGTINTNSAGGVSVTGAAVKFDQPITATNGGGVSVTNSGQLTMGSMTLGGAFSQQGGGNVSAAGTVTTTGGGITFTNAVMLTGALSLDTGNSGNILFSSTINGNQDLSLNAGASGSITLSGNAQIGSLTVSNADNVNFAAVNLNGNLSVTAQGTVQLNGNVNGSGTQVYDGNVATGNNLQLTGNTVTFNSRLSPGGDSADTTFTIQGNLAFGAGAVVYLNLDGVTAGSFDQIDVTGSGIVTINPAATLTGEAGYSYSALNGGDNVTIISAPHAVTGEFAQLTSVTIGGQAFNIEYAAGSGNKNVVLNRAMTVWTWVGLGTDNNWSDSANWGVTSGSPGSGDTVHFSGSLGTTPNNDKTGIDLTEIIFDAGAAAFTLDGNAVSLAGGIVNNSSQTETVNMPISLDVDQTFNAAAGPLAFGTSGTVDGGVTLTLSGSGFTFNGAIGSGTPLTAVNADTGMTANAAVDATALNTVAAAYDVALDGGGSISDGITFNNTGGVGLGGSNSASDSLYIGGGIDTQGNATTLGGTILTPGQPITITSATLAAAATLDTTNNGLASGGSDINLTVAGGGYGLTLDGGSNGQINLSASGVFGAFAVTHGAGFTMTSGITASSINVTASAINIQGLFATTAGAITFDGPVTMTSDLLVDATDSGADGAGNSIAFASSVQGPYILYLNGGTGGAVTAASAVTVNALLLGNAASFDFSGSVSATALFTAGQPYSIAFNGGVGIADAVQFVNSGVVTLAGTSTFSGGVDTINGATHPSNTILNGTLLTPAQPISLGSVTLSGNSLIDSTDAGASPGGASISLGAVTGGGNSLTLNAGTGGAVTGTSMTGVNVLTLSNAASFAFSGSLGATTLATADQPYTIALDGGGAITNAVQFLNTGAVTLGGTTTFSGGVDTVTGASHPADTILAGTVLTAAKPIVLGVVNLGGDSALDTTDAGLHLGGANITITSTIDGGQNLSLDAGTGGTITLDGAVGSGTPLAALTFVDSNGVTASGSIAAGSVSQSAGGGTTDFQGTINTTAVGGVNISGNAVTFAQLVTTTGGGGVTVTNTGLLTMGSMTLSGDFLEQGAGGTVSAAGFIRTAGQTITFSNALTPSGLLVLESTNGGGSPGGANINLGAVNGGGNVLILNGGTGGAVTGNSTISLNTLALADAASFNFNGAVTATAIATEDEPYTAAFNAGGTITDAVQFLNTGTVTLGGTMTFVGGVDTINGATHPAGTILDGAVLTKAAAIRLGTVTLSGGSSLDTTDAGSSPGGAGISLGAVSGGGQSLSLTAGTGGAVTGTSMSGVNVLTFASAASFAFSGAVSATALVTADQPYTVALNGGTITAAVQFVNTGTVTLAGSTTFAGGVDAINGATHPASTILNGTVLTAAGPISLGGVTLSGNSSLDATDAGGSPSGANISLGAVNGSAYNLTLNGGTSGTVTGQATISVSTLTLSNAASFSFDGAMDVLALTTAGKPYSVAFLAGGTIIDPVQFLNTGTVTLDGTAFFFNGVDAVNGATHPSSTNLNGTILTVAAPISLGSITLTGDGSLDTTAGGGVPFGTNIRLGAVTGGGHNLTLNGGVFGTVTGVSTSGVNTLTLADAASFAFSGSLAATTLATVNQPYSVALNDGGMITNAVQFLNTGTVTLGGVTTFTGGLDTSNGATHPAGTILNGAVLTPAKPIVLGKVDLSGGSALDTTDAGSSPGGANIVLNSTLDGPQNLSLRAGTGGTISLNGAVGSLTRLGAISFIQSNGVTAAGGITAASIAQAADTGTTDFQGAINTNASAGVNIAGNTITFAQPVTTTGGGGVAVTNSGLLTVNSMDLSGSFLQQGGGNVAAEGTLATAGMPITFTDPLALIGGLSLDATNAGAAAGGAIVFNSTVDGGFTFYVNAGTKSASFFANIGSIQPLAQLLVARADGGLNFGTDLRPLTSITTTGAITLGSAVPTGPIVFDGGANSGDALMLKVTGHGSPGSFFTLNGPATLASNVVINVGQATANGVTFTPAATVNSLTGRPRSLTILGGSGGVAFQDDIGFANPLSQITVNTSGLISIANGDAIRTLNSDTALNPDQFVSGVSSVPLPLRVNPPNLGQPLVRSNTTQTITGQFGGNPSMYASDHTELGQNFQITVVWGDKIVSKSPLDLDISAGDTVTLFVNQSGSVQVWNAVPGATNSGPVKFIFQHQYAYTFLVTAGLHVTTSITVSDDSTFGLIDARSSSFSLTSAQGTVQTPVEGNQFITTQLQSVDARPAEPELIEENLVAPEPPINTLPEAKPAENVRPPSEHSDQSQRQLILVRVGADGEEGDPHVLPDDALERLNDLFEKFKQMGLPNGRYRIYLEETGFPKRQLREFYKSGDTIGDPVREPGPGSRPLQETPQRPATRSATLKSATPQNGPPKSADAKSLKPATVTSPAKKINAPLTPAAVPAADNRPAEDSAAATETMWRTLGRFKYPLAAAAVAAVQGARANNPQKNDRLDPAEKPARRLGLLARVRRAAMGRKAES